MERYRNRAGNSGVVAYEAGRDCIKVQFADGDVYTYTYGSAGRANVERMKKLARAGRGLSGFVSTHVRDRFATKESGRKPH